MILRGIDLDSVVPVVSLLMYRDDSRSQVLLGVRRQSATSTRHPDVLSTPTMRIPVSTMVDLLSAESERSVELVPPYFMSLPQRRAWQVGVPYSLATPQAFVAEALIARKLGLAPALVDGDLRAELRQSALAYDLVHDDEGGYEQTLMLTMSCQLSVSPPALPSSSPGYSLLAWVDAGEVGTAVTTKDPVRLVPGVSPLQVCIHGLCVRSAAFALANGG
ncbi:hypothetical protein [Micromonospora sp. CA-244673]|uniref:hypothetical protein n=1 Tax=Micromonospora sp. CA-244673 TaxID=3239958 RepID=UPI003D944B5E